MRPSPRTLATSVDPNDNSEISDPEKALSADERLKNWFGGTDSNVKGGSDSAERSLDDKDVASS